MKRIILSSVAVVAVVALTAGATYAYFSATTTITGNTISAGTLIINDASESWMLSANFENLKPGDRVRRWVVLRNEGTTDIGTLKVTAINKIDSSPSFLDKLIVSATGRVGESEPAYFTNDWGEPKATINSWMDGADMLSTSYYRTPAGVIHPGESYTMTFDFIVPAELGNEYQGLASSFDMEFYAEQVIDH